MKPGYQPPEDVEVYKNKTADGFRNRGKGPIPGAEKAGPVMVVAATGATGKNAKRREARKRAAGADGEVVEGKGEGDKGNEGEAEIEQVDPEVEVAKEARKLAKKLRQARELKERKEGGDGLLPEQIAKVVKIQELVRQLDGLGFDCEGERKVEGKGGEAVG